MSANKRKTIDNIKSNTAEMLLKKSKEAFIMSIEIYNKPTIKYRAESFSFFIVNAWELMLKAYIIETQGEAKIYFSDNPNRTITISNAIGLIYTNKNDPLRKNLEKVIKFRDMNTHFITEEYEQIYIPLFQACVNNYVDQLSILFNDNINDYIPNNFLVLPLNYNFINDDAIKAKYSREIAEKLFKEKDLIQSETNSASNHKYAVVIEHQHFITKDKNEASSVVAIDANANDSVTIIKQLQNPNHTHPYLMSNLIEEINKKLKKNDIKFLDTYSNETNAINKYHINLFIKYYKIKEDPKYCFVFKETFTYSMQVIDLVVEQLIKKPEIIPYLKEELKK